MNLCIKILNLVKCAVISGLHGDEALPLAPLRAIAPVAGYRLERRLMSGASTQARVTSHKLQTQ